MTAQHTPGPWHRNIKPASKYPVIWSGRNTHVAIVVTGGLPDAEMEANCSLITAAPELLSALEELIGWQTTAPPAVIEQARAAITRARQ